MLDWEGVLARRHVSSSISGNIQQTQHNTVFFQMQCPQMRLYLTTVYHYQDSARLKPSQRLRLQKEKHTYPLHQCPANSE